MRKDYEDEILIEVNDKLSKPKVRVLVDMKRQKEREGLFGIKEANEEEEDKIAIDVNYK